MGVEHSCLLGKGEREERRVREDGEGGNLVLFEEVSDSAGQRVDGSALLGHHLLQVQRDA